MPKKLEFFAQLKRNLPMDITWPILNEENWQVLNQFVTLRDIQSYLSNDITALGVHLKTNDWLAEFSDSSTKKTRTKKGIICFCHVFEVLNIRVIYVQRSNVIASAVTFYQRVKPKSVEFDSAFQSHLNFLLISLKTRSQHIVSDLNVSNTD